MLTDFICFVNRGLSNHLVSTGSDKGMLPKGKPEQPPILTMVSKGKTLLQIMSMGSIIDNSAWYDNLEPM